MHLTNAGSFNQIQDMPCSGTCVPAGQQTIAVATKAMKPRVGPITAHNHPQSVAKPLWGQYAQASSTPW